MSARIVVRHLAKRDLLTASKSYEGQRAGLGVSFVEEVNALLEHLREYPESYAPLFQEVRAATIDRFPYVVYYTYAKNIVRVIAVVHGSRDSETWRSRL